MAVFKKSKAKSEEQTDEQKALVGNITKLYKDAYNNKSELHTLWDRCFKAYESELFKKQLPDYKIQEISNFVFGTIETVKPIMLANNPKFLVMPRSESGFGKAKAVQYAMEYEWQRTKMFTLLQQSITLGLILGTVPIACLWDAKASREIGEITPKVISPFNIFPDPMATNIEDAEYMIYAVYKNVGEIIKAYPEKAELLRKATSAPDDEYLTYGKDTSNVQGKSNILYIECYKKDYATEDSIEEEKDEESGETKKYKVTKLKYPNGRRVILAGDVLLEDGENPYEDGKFPFVLWKCYDVPGRFWGIGEVQMIISPQEAICEINNAIIENAGLMGNPVWILDKNSGVEKGSLTNRKGLVIRKNPGTEVKREAPPPLPAYIQNIPVQLMSDMEKISGVYDVTRGERPSGITAAAAIQALNEQAQGRIKLKVQAMEQMLGELGSMWLSRIQQFWVTKRCVRVMGIDYPGMQQQQQMQGAMSQQGMPQDEMEMQMMQIGGQNVGFTWMDKDTVDGDFDIFIVGGSTMPVNKSAKLQLMIQLAQTPAEDGLPMVDRQTLLENADIDNIEEVMQRFAAIKEQQMQAQQAQQEAEMKAQQQQLQMQQQQQQQQMMMQQQAEKEKMAAQHQMSLEQKQADVEGKMTLQQGQADIQSKQDEESQQIKMLVQQLLSMPENELKKLIQADPRIGQLLQLYAQSE